jgi:D-glycero-D-manno-heptose 1,7-bisphosphate phosphatase
MNKACFIELNCIMDHQSNGEVAQEVVRGLLHLQDRGYFLMLVSEEPCPDKGVEVLSIVEGKYRILQKKLKARGVRVRDWFYCMHTDDESCMCKFPSDYLMKRAAKEYGLSLEDCIMVGDIGVEILTGDVAGMQTVLCCPTKEYEGPKPEAEIENLAMMPLLVP